MEQPKTNIVKLLRENNVALGTMFFSPICGNVTLKHIKENEIACSFTAPNGNNSVIYFNAYGQVKFYKNGLDGECLLFPSERIRDWSVISWRPGDVLVPRYANDEMLIFGGFSNSSRDVFCAPFIIVYPHAKEGEGRFFFFDSTGLPTHLFRRCRCEETRDKFLQEILTRFGVEVKRGSEENFLTPKLVKGDYVFIRCYNEQGEMVDRRIAVLDRYDVVRHVAHCIVAYDFDKLEMKTPEDVELFSAEKDPFQLHHIQLATLSQILELNSALASKGLRFDRETMSVKSLFERNLVTKPFVFKPFDKVLVRNKDSEHWRPAFFACERDGTEGIDRIFGVINAHRPLFFMQCVPYNKETEHLLETNDVVLFHLETV
nr:MAG TPA: hypothetical protein [Caudoviricetes sp.]